MAAKNSHEPDTQGEPQPPAARSQGLAPELAPSNEPEIGFENREDYEPGRSGPRSSCCAGPCREFIDDGGTDLAAALTYYSVLAIFPALIALMALVGVFGQAQESVDAIMEILAPLVTTDDHGSSGSRTS